MSDAFPKGLGIWIYIYINIYILASGPHFIGRTGRNRINSKFVYHFLNRVLSFWLWKSLNNFWKSFISNFNLNSYILSKAFIIYLWYALSYISPTHCLLINFDIPKCHCTKTIIHRIYRQCPSITLTKTAENTLPVTCFPNGIATELLHIFGLSANLCRNAFLLIYSQNFTYVLVYERAPTVQ